jgi:hypothetical protein
VLVVMGSGETSPTMVTTHRELVARFGPASPRAVLLDTPYGFQENAHEISGRALEYFARSVGLEMEVAGFPGPLAAAPGADAPAAAAAALARLRSAGFVFSGPGSPTYALRVWRESPVPEALVAKLLHGGVVVFASAAAATLGRWALPVYEVYKVGLPPYWLDGLDLLGLLGVGADGVVIPHYDNAEGGTHDTRFCYMGERRLAALEILLPEGAWILGVDEHTALVVDLDSGDLAVTGRGAVTVRRRGVSRRFPAGTSAAVNALAVPGREETVAADAHAAPLAPGGTAADAVAPHRGASPLLQEVARQEQAFEAAVASRRSREAVDPRAGPDHPRLVGRHAAVRRARSRARGPALPDPSTGRGGVRRSARPARGAGATGRGADHAPDVASDGASVGRGRPAPRPARRGRDRAPRRARGHPLDPTALRVRLRSAPSGRPPTPAPDGAAAPCGARRG